MWTLITTCWTIEDAKIAVTNLIKSNLIAHWQYNKLTSGYDIYAKDGIICMN